MPYTQLVEMAARCPSLFAGYAQPSYIGHLTENCQERRKIRDRLDELATERIEVQGQLARCIEARDQLRQSGAEATALLKRLHHNAANAAHAQRVA
jgi:uncharacterized coiled-coil DUF342 family protein